MEARKGRARRGQSDLGDRELREEGGEEVLGRETTSFVNAQNIVEDSEEQRQTGRRGDR